MRLGQRISPFLVDGILRGKHEKRLGQFADFAAGGDGFFLHRLQHGGLRFGRRAVDFVRQNEMGENRPALKLEFAASARQLP